jgi:hypothetical protein
MGQPSDSESALTGRGFSRAVNAAKSLWLQPPVLQTAPLPFMRTTSTGNLSSRDLLGKALQIIFQHPVKLLRVVDEQCMPVALEAFQPNFFAEL